MWFWQAMYGALDFAKNLVIKYFYGALGLIVGILSVTYVLSLVAQTYQNPVLQFFDEMWSCLIIPVYQFELSVGWTVGRGFYEFSAIRWNDLISAMHDCFTALFNEILDLPGFEFVSFYTGIPLAFIRFAECLSSAPFFVPTLQIPFGVNGLFFAFISSDWCMYNLAASVIFRTMDYQLFRNDCVFCAIDPDADCYLRFIDSSAVPPFLPTIIGPDCTGCVSADCDFIACSLYLLSNTTQVLFQPLGVDITDLVDESIPSICCFVTEFYKRPFYLFIGLFTGCYSFDDAPDILLDIVERLASCILEFFFIISGDTVDDIFVFIFAVFFPFVQAVIDSYNNLVACGGLSAQCFNQYPNNCAVSSSGVATSGLSSCALIFGNCVVLGTSTIPRNELLRFPPFTNLFQTIFPNILKLVDAIVCQFVPIRGCIFGPSIPGTPSIPDCGEVSLSNFITVFRCAIRCFNNRVILLRPFTGIIDVFLRNLDDLLGLIRTIVNTTFESIVGFCDDVASALSFSCPIDFTPIPGLKQERKNQHLFKGHYEDWYDFLEYHHVDENTTCGSVLYALDKNAKKFPGKEDFGFYIAFWGCIGFMYSGMQYQDRYTTVDMNRLMNLHTIVDEHIEVARCITNENSENYLRQEDLRSEMYNFKVEYTEAFRGNWNHTLVPEVFPLEESQVESWSIMVNKAKATHDTLIMGFAERLNRIEGVYMTGKFIEFYNVLNKMDVQLKRSRIGRVLKKNQHNYTVEDMLPDDTKTIALLKERFSNLDVQLANIDDTLEYRRYELEIQKTKEQLTLDYGSMMANWLKGIGDNTVAEVQMRRRLRGRNSEKTFLQQYKETGFQEKKPWVLTHALLAEKRAKLAEWYRKIDIISNAASDFLGWINPGGRLVKKIITSEPVKELGFVKTGSIMIRHLTDPSSYNNITLYATNKIQYTIDEGFMSLEQYSEKVRNRDNSSFYLFSILEGTYNPRRPTKYKFGLIPAEIKEGGFTNYGTNWKRHVAQEKLRVMKELGIDPNSEEGKNFRLSSVNSSLDNLVIRTIEWIVNNFISTLFRIFQGAGISVDLVQFLINFLDSLDPLQILEEGGNEVLNFVEFLVTCNRPEDYDGTFPYKLACLPYLPEGLFKWLVPVGFGNAYVPLQFGLVPEELFVTPCVNVFNGDPHLFTYRPSNNCGNDDGYPRPRCNTKPQCDYCERTYNSCAVISFNGIIDSFAFIIGIIGPILQLYYRGIVPTNVLTNAFLFATMYVLPIGIMSVGSWIIASGPSLAFMYFGTVNVLEYSSQLLGYDERGIAYGLLYIIFLSFITVLNIIISIPVPDVIKAMAWVFAVSWMFNVFVPFENIQRDLRLNEWIAAAFEFLDSTPQPALPIPWGDLVGPFRRFDYSRKGVPYADTFCFFFTISNVLIGIIGAILLVDVVNFLYVIGYPFVIFFSGLISAVLQLIQNLRNYDSRIALEGVIETQKTFKEEYRKNLLKMRSDIAATKQKMAEVFSPRINNFASIDDTRLMDWMVGYD